MSIRGLYAGRLSLKYYFGEEFAQDLMSWAPTDWDATLLAQQLHLHSRLFNLPLPPTESAGETFVPDPTQQRQMVVKLFNERKRHLQELLHMERTTGGAVGKRESTSCAVLDPLTRAFGTFTSAVRRFQTLKRRGL